MKMKKERSLVKNKQLFLCAAAASFLIAYASPLLAGLEYVGPSERTVGEALTAMTTRTPLNINKEGPSDMVFIYGGANAAGLYGAFYQTDIGIISPGLGSNETGLVYFTLYVLPANANGNPSLQGHDYTMPAGAFGIFKNVVGNAGVSGAATIMLAVNHTKSTISSGYQYVAAWGRTYTTAPTGGQFSTTLPVTCGWVLTTSNFVVATGIQQDSSRRTNVSAFNHDTAGPITLRYYIFDSNGANIGTQDVTIPPLSSVQISLSAFYIGDPGGTIRAVATSTYGDSTIYAVTVDNMTNDGDVRLLTYSFM